MAWSRMQEYLEMLHAFGVYTGDQVFASPAGLTKGEIDEDSLAVKAGMHYYFESGMIQKIGDFMMA